MKYLTYLAVSVLIFTWTACGHGRPADTIAMPTPLTPANSTTQPQTIPVNLGGDNSPTTTVVPTGTTALGMNPAHGQPGHRCDIAVGAPLNSAPAQQTTPAITTPGATPINISPDKLITQPAATTVTAPGMNPAHGQPGHRCDIAVGAPLNSAPTQQPATAATTPLNISTDKLTTQPAAKTVTAPGMNPPHGEPGHRCDIAVGAPLSSKPVLVTGTPSTNTVTSSQSIPSIVPIKTLPADSSKQKR